MTEPTDTEELERIRVSAEMLLQDGQEAVQDGDLESAHEFLRMAAELDPERIELEGYVDQVRSQLVKQYRDRVGDTSRAPRIVGDPAAITRFNLPANAGFLLSFVDGNTTVDEIITLSGLGTFEALRILDRLLEADIATVTP